MVAWITLRKYTMSKLVAGRALRDEIISKLKVKVAKLNCKPKLAIVLVGDDEASRRYIKQKQKAATEIGAEAILINFPKSVSQQELERKISELNQDESVTGVIIQLPLPNSLDTNSILQKINPKHAVDGLTENSMFQP